MLLPASAARLECRVPGTSAAFFPPPPRLLLLLLAVCCCSFTSRAGATATTTTAVVSVFLPRAVLLLPSSSALLHLPAGRPALRRLGCLSATLFCCCRGPLMEPRSPACCCLPTGPQAPRVTCEMIIGGGGGRVGRRWREGRVCGLCVLVVARRRSVMWVDGESRTSGREGGAGSRARPASVFPWRRRGGRVFCPLGGIKTGAKSRHSEMTGRSKARGAAVVTHSPTPARLEHSA